MREKSQIVLRDGRIVFPKGRWTIVSPDFHRPVGPKNQAYVETMGNKAKGRFNLDEIQSLSGFGWRWDND